MLKLGFMLFKNIQYLRNFIFYALVRYALLAEIILVTCLLK